MDRDQEIGLENCQGRYMLCNLAVRRTLEDDAISYTLRVIGRTALGPSSAGGRDSKDYATVEALLADLQSLGVSGGYAVAAEIALTNPKSLSRYIDFADGVQISFETLESSGVHLFDLD